jgi:hypothetical protein
MELVTDMNGQLHDLAALPPAPEKNLLIRGQSSLSVWKFTSQAGH